MASAARPRIEAGALGHHPVDGAAQLFGDLIGADLRHRGRVSAPVAGEPFVSGVDRALPAFDGDISHGSALSDPDAAGQGAGRRHPAQSRQVHAAGEEPVVGFPLRDEITPADPCGAMTVGASSTPARTGSAAGHSTSAGTCRITVAALSGAASVPAKTSRSGGKRCDADESGLRRWRGARTTPA